MNAKVSHALFYKLLSQLPHSEKEDWVWTYSDHTTTSLRVFVDRNPDGYRTMIEDMKHLIEQRTGVSPDELRYYRSAVLKRLQKHGVDTTDWNAVNRFMRQPQIAGKTLGELSLDELKKTIAKMESILAKDAEKQRKIKQLSQYN